MKGLFWKVYNPQILKFATVGISVAVIGALVLVLLKDAGLSAKRAYFIQGVIAIELNFLGNNFLTWRERRHRPFWYRLATFNFSKIFTVAFNQAVFALLTSVLGLYYLTAYLICIVLSSGLNYLLSDLLVFRRSSVQESA